jgi:hypothetical protein
MLHFRCDCPVFLRISLFIVSQKRALLNRLIFNKSFAFHLTPLISDSLGISVIDTHTTAKSGEPYFSIHRMG